MSCTCAPPQPIEESDVHGHQLRGSLDVAVQSFGSLQYKLDRRGVAINELGQRDDPVSSTLDPASSFTDLLVTVQSEQQQPPFAQDREADLKDMYVTHEPEEVLVEGFFRPYELNRSFGLPVFSTYQWDKAVAWPFEPAFDQSQGGLRPPIHPQDWTPYQYQGEDRFVPLQRRLVAGKNVLPVGTE